MRQRKIPQRMCVGCQEMRNKKDLIRVVRAPTGEVVLDFTGKKPGRGAYLCKSEQCLTKAFKEKRLEKALKHSIEPNIYEEIKIRLEAHE